MDTTLPDLKGSKACERLINEHRERSIHHVISAQQTSGRIILLLLLLLMGLYMNIYEIPTVS